MSKTSAIALCCFGLSHAFTPFPRILRLDASHHFVTRLSEIEDESAKEPAWIKYEEENAGYTQKSSNGVNPDNYEGLVDGDSFDGGDGQVGCVGDGSNAMETFDQQGTVQQNAAGRGRRVAEGIGGSESKKTQKNVFGMTTGYAEELKKQGMVQIDEYGDDKMLARRQQLENWRNQRELKARQNSGLQELADYTGVEYDQRRATQSYMNVLGKQSSEFSDDNKFTIIGGTQRSAAATEAATGLTKGDITETIELTSAFPSPAFHEIKVYNDAMSYEAFTVGFSPESVNGGADYQVSPLSGELNRRGGEPTPLSIVFKPNEPGGAPRHVFLVVETEESKFTYEIIGNVQ